MDGSRPCAEMERTECHNYHSMPAAIQAVRPWYAQDSARRARRHGQPMCHPCAYRSTGPSETHGMHEVMDMSGPNDEPRDCDAIRIVRSVDYRPLSAIISDPSRMEAVISMATSSRSVCAAIRSKALMRECAGVSERERATEAGRTRDGTAQSTGLVEASKPLRTWLRGV